MNKEKMEIVFEALNLKKKHEGQKNEELMKLAQSLALGAISYNNVSKKCEAMSNSE